MTWSKSGRNIVSMGKRLKGNINVCNIWQMQEYPGQCEIVGIFEV